MRDWSMITALIGARLRAEHAAQVRERHVERVGSEAILVGVELHRAQPARVAQVEAAAVGERKAEAVPRRDGTIARVDQRVARRLAVDQHASAHAEMEADHRAAVGVDQDQLPPPTCGGELLSAERGPHARGVRPRFKNHASGACTVSIFRCSAFASISRRADSTSRISGKRAPAQKFVIAPRSAPCASFAYFARKPLV